MKKMTEKMKVTRGMVLVYRKTEWPLIIRPSMGRVSS